VYCDRVKSRPAEAGQHGSWAGAPFEGLGILKEPGLTSPRGPRVVLGRRGLAVVGRCFMLDTRCIHADGSAGASLRVGWREPLLFGAIGPFRGKVFPMRRQAGAGPAARRSR